MPAKITDFLRRPPALMVIIIAFFVLFVLAVSGELGELAKHEGESAHKTEVTEEKETPKEAELEKEEVEEETHEEAGEETHEKAGEEEEEVDEEAEEEEKAAHGEEEHHPPPALYFFQWILLLAALGAGGLYAGRIYKRGKPKHERILLAYVLTFLVFAIYGLGYVPAIKEYHEPGWASFFKFILLILCTIVVTFYGVLGRHDEHDQENSSTNHA